MSDDAATLANLRTTAIDLVRRSDWAPLLELMRELEADEKYWVPLWGPCCAVAAEQTSPGTGRPLLDRVVDAGFYDADAIEALEATYGDSPDWPSLRARMDANRPPPAVELLDWPTAPPQLAPELDRLPPEDEARLAGRLPAPTESAWETAEQTLAWVTSRWRHTSANHADRPDGNLILDRVSSGERFACKEFTVLLTQALNALCIPARRVSLFRADHHLGLGAAHAVTEAWVDDLGRWVLLDGQNGAVWRDADGTPLGVVDLQARCRAGARPQFTGSGPNFDPDTAAEWFRYFVTVAVTGLAWSPAPFVPIFEGGLLITAQRLDKDSGQASPDLATLTTEVVDADGPALVFDSAHPFAEGVTVTGPDRAHPLATGKPYPLSAPPGEHRLQVATRTPYGLLRPADLVYRTS